MRIEQLVKHVGEFIQVRIKKRGYCKYGWEESMDYVLDMYGNTFTDFYVYNLNIDERRIDGCFQDENGDELEMFSYDVDDLEYDIKVKGKNFLPSWF